MTNLASAFIRLAGRAAQGLTNTLNLWCDLCGRQTVFKLIDETGGVEVYQCESCRVVTLSFTVK